MARFTALLYLKTFLFRDVYNPGGALDFFCIGVFFSFPGIYQGILWFSTLSLSFSWAPREAHEVPAVECKLVLSLWLPGFHYLTLVHSSSIFITLAKLILPSLYGTWHLSVLLSTTSELVLIFWLSLKIKVFPYILGCFVVRNISNGSKKSCDSSFGCFLF